MVSLGAGCKNLGKAAHETMHALGFIHEHQSWGISLILYFILENSYLICNKIKFKNLNFSTKKFFDKKVFLSTNKFNRSIDTLKRSDRDKFVKIVLKNAGQYCGTTGKETCAGNFAKAPKGLVDYPEEYDKVNTI